MLPISRINYELAHTASQAQEFHDLGFTCKKVSFKYTCEKLELVDSLPAHVANALINKAPYIVNFSEIKGEYLETHRTEAYTEWLLKQITFLDGFQIDQLHWRDQKGSPSKVLLEDDRGRFEFLVLGNALLGSTQSIIYTDPNTRKRADYQGIVLLKK